MPHLLQGEEIIKLIETNVLQNAKKENAEGIKYDFTLGTKILKASYKTPIDLSDLSAGERSKIGVDPGEIVFVLTEERLKLPDNIYIVLIPKRKLSHEGILILGGLSVDPFYEGRLLIGIYNFSSSSFPIRAGKKIIGSHFYKLRDDEINKDAIKHEINIDDFPDDLIRLMDKYSPISSLSLMEKISSVELKLEEFKKDFNKTESWFKEFQTKLDKHEELVSRLIEGLKEEQRSRSFSDEKIEADVKKFRDELTSHSNRSYKSSVWIGIFSAIATGVIVGVIVLAIQLFSQRTQQTYPSNPLQKSPIENRDTTTKK